VKREGERKRAMREREREREGDEREGERQRERLRRDVLERGSGRDCDCGYIKRKKEQHVENSYIVNAGL
jgi:hypothetical protein